MTHFCAIAVMFWRRRQSVRQVPSSELSTRRDRPLISPGGLGLPLRGRFGGWLIHGALACDAYPCRLQDRWMWSGHGFARYGRSALGPHESGVARRDGKVECAVVGTDSRHGPERGTWCRGAGLQRQAVVIGPGDHD